VTFGAFGLGKTGRGAERREIPDGAIPGLWLVVRPNGASAKLTLGSANITGQEPEGEPAIGGHLTLAAARRLAAEVNRQRALGRDPAAEAVAEKHRARIVAGERASNTFGAVVHADWSSTCAQTCDAGGRRPCCSGYARLGPF
jgi:hypothetical protein